MYIVNKGLRSTIQHENKNITKYLHWHVTFIPLINNTPLSIVNNFQLVYLNTYVLALQQYSVYVAGTCATSFRGWSTRQMTVSRMYGQMMRAPQGQTMKMQNYTITTLRWWMTRVVRDLMCSVVLFFKLLVKQQEKMHSWLLHKIKQTRSMHFIYFENFF